MTDGWNYFIEHAGQRHALETRQMTVGRSRKCDISVPDPSVSRKHVYLTAGGGQVVLQDLGSSNGTFINGERVEGTQILQHGHTLELGDAVLHVKVMSKQPAAPPAPEPVAVSDVESVASPQMGDATSMLQAESVRLAQEAMAESPAAPAGPTAAPAGPTAAPAGPTAAPAGPTAAEAPAAPWASAPGQVTTRLDPSQLGDLSGGTGSGPPPVAAGNATARIDPSQLAAAQAAAAAVGTEGDGGMATQRLDVSQLPQGLEGPGMATQRLDPSQLPQTPEGPGMATQRLDPSQLPQTPEGPGMATQRLDPSQLPQTLDGPNMATQRLDPAQLVGLGQGAPPPEAPPLAMPEEAGAAAPSFDGPSLEASPVAPPAIDTPAVDVPASEAPSAAVSSFETPSFDASPSFEAPPSFDAPPSFEAPSFDGAPSFGDGVPAAAAPPKVGAASGSFKGLLDESFGGIKPPEELLQGAPASPPMAPDGGFTLPPEPVAPAAPAAPASQATPDFGTPVPGALPSMEPPVGDTPSFDAVPAAETPSFEAPTLEVPSFDADSVEAPALETPSFDAAPADLPSFEAPSFDAPSFDAPAQDVPSFAETPALDPISEEPPAFGATPALPDSTLEPPDVPAVSVGAPDLDAPPAFPPSASPVSPPSSDPLASSPPAAPPPVTKSSVPGVSAPPLEFPDLSSTDPGMTDIRNLGLPSPDETGVGNRSELLPSLDGFDTTLGPGVEMPVALEQAHQNMVARQEVDSTEEVVLPTAQYNPYQPTKGAEPPRAGFWIRALAALLDSVWIGALSFAAVFFGDQLIGLSVTAACYLVILVGWSVWGQTPGKRLVGIYVCRKDGKPGIGFLHALIRLAGYFVSSLILGIGFLLALGEEKRTLHDRIAGTYVRKRR